MWNQICDNDDQQEMKDENIRITSHRRIIDPTDYPARCLPQRPKMLRCNLQIKEGQLLNRPHRITSYREKQHLIICTEDRQNPDHHGAEIATYVKG